MFGRGYGFNYGLGGGAYVPAPPPPPPVIPTIIISPNTAPPGGLVSFSVYGIDINSRDEDFTNGDIRTGPVGPGSTHPHWYTDIANPACQSGSGVLLKSINGQCNIVNDNEFNYGDLSIRFEIQTGINASVPTCNTTYAGLQLAGPLGNITVQRVYDYVTGSHRYVANILDIAYGSLPAIASDGTLRIIWCRNTVLVLVRDSQYTSWQVLAQTATLPLKFISATATIFSNNSADELAATKVLWFKSTPNVLLGNILAVETQPVSGGVVATIPQQPSKNIKQVPVYLFNHGGIVGTGIFTYIIKSLLKLSVGPFGRTDLV